MTGVEIAPCQLRGGIAWPYDDGAGALAARAVVASVGLYERPAAPLPWRRLTHPTAAGLPLVLLALAHDRGDWLRVQVPLRPNGATAWVHLADVRLTQTYYRVTVRVGARRLNLHWHHRLVLDAPVAVGRDRTPTPTGDFYVESSVNQVEHHPLYGRYGLGLSGFSEVLATFNGGNGQLAIHGTGRPDLLGRAVTAGCIRLGDDDILRLSRLIPLGTPVRIRA